MWLIDKLFWTQEQREEWERRLAEFRLSLEADTQILITWIKLEADSQMEAITRAGEIEMDKINTDFISNQKINILTWYINAENQVMNMWDDWRKMVLWTLSYVKWFLSLNSLERLGSTFASMWLELPEDIKQDIIEKSEDLKKKYEDKIEELESQWKRILAKMDI